MIFFAKRAKLLGILATKINRKEENDFAPTLKLKCCLVNVGKNDMKQVLNLEESGKYNQSNLDYDNDFFCQASKVTWYFGNQNKQKRRKRFCPHTKIEMLFGKCWQK